MGPKAKYHGSSFFKLATENAKDTAFLQVFDVAKCFAESFLICNVPCMQSHELCKYDSCMKKLPKHFNSVVNDPIKPVVDERDWQAVRNSP